MDSQAEIADFSNQGIEDLGPFAEVVFAKMPMLKELNLSNNMINSIPSEMYAYLPNLESINLNNNQIPQEDSQFAAVVDELAKIGQNNITKVGLY